MSLADLGSIAAHLILVGGACGATGWLFGFLAGSR